MTHPKQDRGSTRGTRRLGVLAIGLLAALLQPGCEPAAAPATSETAPPPASAAEAARVDAPVQPATGDPLPTAFGELLARIESANATLPGMAAYGSEAERVAGYRHLSRSIIKALQNDVLQDVDFPFFRIIDFWSREGGDNPDQQYAFTPIRGGDGYRIWGRLGSARRLEFQLYAGDPWDGSGRSAGFMAFEDLHLEADGSFELYLTPEPREGNWLENPADANQVFARHIYDQWSTENTGEIHIDRVGHEGDRMPESRASELAEDFRAAAATFEKAALGWPRFIEQRYGEAAPINRIPALVDTYTMGGVRGRWMANGRFELEPGKALLIKSWPTAAHYQAIQLADLWFASLEYANRVSSLNSTQQILSPDGAYYTVISTRDPGHANWLDPGEIERGVFLMRFDGVQGAIPEEQHPTAELVDFDSLPDRIPGFERVAPKEREETRAARRAHLQKRSHR